MRPTEETTNIRERLKRLAVGGGCAFRYTDSKHLHRSKQIVFTQQHYHGGKYATHVDADNMKLIVVRTA